MDICQHALLECGIATELDPAWRRVSARDLLQTFAGQRQIASERRRADSAPFGLGQIFQFLFNGDFYKVSVWIRDHAYERTSLTDLRWSEVTVLPATRALGQLRIRRHVDTIAHTYDLDRPF